MFRYYNFVKFLVAIGGMIRRPWQLPDFYIAWLHRPRASNVLDGPNAHVVFRTATLKRFKSVSDILMDNARWTTYQNSAFTTLYFCTFYNLLNFRSKVRNVRE